jgi:signal transduction histidine kinase
MRIHKPGILLLALLFCLQYSAFSDTVIFSPNTKTIEIGSEVFIMEDESSQLGIEEVSKSLNFKKSTLNVPNFGVSSSTFWVRFEVKNTSSFDTLLLELAYPVMDEAELHTFAMGKEIDVQKMGDKYIFSNRKYKHQNYIFSLYIPKNETRTYYMKIKSVEQLLVPLSLSTSQTIFETNLVKDLIFGIYLGLIFAMFCYNIFIFFTVRDNSYLYYVFYIIFFGLTQASLNGYTFRYLSPNDTWLTNTLITVFPSCSGIALALFMRNFLSIDEHNPFLNKVLYLFIGIYVTAIFSSFMSLHSLSYNLVDLNAGLITLYGLFIGIYYTIKGHRAARFFLLAWSIFLIGIIIFVLRNFGVLPYNDFTNYTMSIGSAIETILLSFALADRINILKKEKVESQQQAIHTLEENRRLITEQNFVLEQKVTERTSALAKSNDELNAALEELKQAQSQLVNAEKMASLGQLTAGIAHEINNPINFVASNVKPLRRDIEDIYQLIEKYNAAVSDGNATKLKEVYDFKEEIDYEYLKDEISNLLKGIEEGAMRTADIVKGLRVFSRLDENDLKKTSIIEGIDSTLTLLNTEIAASINLVKNYSDLPDIECYPGKMNQVFMNIFNNAIFAISANKERKEKGELVITTSNDKENIRISIKDNGSGMTEEVKNKIFEPFFTTKDVGKGTGLGMSITFSIIKDHKGLIEVNTEYGKGTEFVLILPITQ